MCWGRVYLEVGDDTLGAVVIVEGGQEQSSAIAQANRGGRLAQQFIRVLGKLLVEVLLETDLVQDVVE
jgi:hypothetical protein